MNLSIAPRRQRRYRSKKGFTYSIRKYHYEVEIDLRSQEHVPLVLSESLLAQVIVGSEEPAVFTLKRDHQTITVIDPTTDRKDSQTMSVEESDVSRLVAGSSFISPIFGDFRRNVDSWAFFNIDPDAARQASKDVIDPELGEAGEFLPTILHRMEKKGGEDFLNFENALRGAIPAFKGIRSRHLEVEGKRTFQVIEERLRAGINPRAASDGSIRLLALMVIVYWSARRRQLVCIEEPETGLHPHLARNVIEVLRAASEDTQIISTTR